MDLFIHDIPSKEFRQIYDFAMCIFWFMLFWCGFLAWVCKIKSYKKIFLLLLPVITISFLTIIASINDLKLLFKILITCFILGTFILFSVLIISQINGSNEISSNFKEALKNG
ncbi:hypothetical protein [Staphylococcus sp. Marseille-Q6910]|uniref:hypothetical protein n=1 Tax=Staphylococcus sp. Marseille-Q6910 TaxID=2937990 RepID=UPI0020420906|nr:hypothetical protein [Staphylococcus sp. Marseille-Q6910]